MKPEQFFQVVMLPQGRFADFLHADNDAREALLKQLFSVGLFERVEQWLADRAKRAADEHNLACQDLDRVRAKVAEAAGLNRAPADAGQSAGGGQPADPDSLPATPEGPTGDADWAASLAARAQEDAVAAAGRRDEAAAARELADAALAGAHEVARRARERARLRDQLAELEARQPRIDALADELAAALRANPVRAAVAEAARRVADEKAAAAAQATARAILAAAAVPTDAVVPTDATGSAGAGETAGASMRIKVAKRDRAADVPGEHLTDGSRPRADAFLGPLVAPPDASAAELSALATVAHVESGRLEQLDLALAAALDDEREACDADQAALGHRQALAVHQAEIEHTLPARRRVAEDRVEQALLSARLAPPLLEQSEQLAALAAAVRQRQASLAAAAEAAAAATLARTRAVELRQQRFDAITAELAAALVDDTPCPVCGALDHPDPTEVRADHVGKDEERAAEQEASRREGAATEAHGRVAASTERIRALRAQLLRAPVLLPADETSGPRETDTLAEPLAEPCGTLLDEAVLLAEWTDGTTASPDQIAAELDALSRAFASSADQAFSAARALAGAQADLTAVTEAEKTAHSALATHRAEERQAGLRSAAARDRAARTRGAVPVALRDQVRLASRRDAVARFAGCCAQAAQAVGLADAAAGEARRAEATASAAAADAGFPDPAAALAAVRPLDWTADAEARVQAHREQRVTAQSRLDAGDLAGPDADGPDALAERERTAADARRAHEDALGAAATAGDRADRLTGLLDEYAAVYAAVAPRRAAADQLRRLADLAAGRSPVNLHGMPLSSYVLAARLEEVARAASARLAGMSGGRYTLVHDTGERRDRRRKAGLGLVVLDAWTGRARPTATLSGGETFQAALSLALGLADVVSAESGGHAIDALFVDEGFGTLDPDSLDEVMNVLDELRSGGRLVGVVSHVADLRLRIPTQIRVHKGPGGSTVETTV